MESKVFTCFLRNSQYFFQIFNSPIGFGVFLAVQVQIKEQKIIVSL